MPNEEYDLESEALSIFLVTTCDLVHWTVSSAFPLTRVSE